MRNDDEVVTIRAATASDEPFLREMLVAAAGWRPDSEWRTVDAVLAVPAFAHYIVGWPADGDVGVVAEDEQHRPVGAAWYRYLPPDDPGFGFVSPDVPEITIGVVADQRGRGVGRRLLVSLLEQATARGVPRVSLSVETDNTAMDLYADVGFDVVTEADGAATMVIDLTRPA
ncbi:MAG: N-acetyltransferase family protein [Acidimicrobiales bacterium]